MNETGNKFYIKTRYGITEVDSHIKDVYHDARKEKDNTRKQLHYNRVISYDSFGTEKHTGESVVEAAYFRTDEEAIANIDFENIKQLLHEIDKRYIVRLYLMGYKECEIAKRLGISQAAVNKAKRKILKVLRESIE